MEKGYLTNEEINDIFDNETYRRGVRAFQSQNLDQQGQPLAIADKVGASAGGVLTIGKVKAKLLLV